MGIITGSRVACQIIRKKLHFLLPMQPYLWMRLKKMYGKTRKPGQREKVTPDSEHDGKEKDGKEKGWRETFGLAADEIFSALHGS